MIPDRAPDLTLDDYITPVQNLLYRLTGDTNLVHVDSEYAREMGFPKAFIQGLCSFGVSCRMAIELLCPGEPERMTSSDEKRFIPGYKSSASNLEDGRGEGLFPFRESGRWQADSGQRRI